MRLASLLFLLILDKSAELVFLSGKKQEDKALVIPYLTSGSVATCKVQLHFLILLGNTGSLILSLSFAEKNMIIHIQICTVQDLRV